MLKRLTKWFTESRQWAQEHAEAWAGWTEPTDNNLSRFQVECESAISKTLVEVGASFSERIITPLESGDSELKMTLGKTSFVIWLYSDSISSIGYKDEEFWFEYEDFRTPKELIEAVVSRVRNVTMKGHESAA